ncbi:MAG: nitrate/nitrite transporter NrtS [Pseudoruegeria sp.]
MSANRPHPNPASDLGFWDIALSRLVVKRATRIALVVGTVLATINHGDRLMYADLNFAMIVKILLTFCVPYSVSTYSSVLAIRENSVTQRSEK